MTDATVASLEAAGPAGSRTSSGRTLPDPGGRRPHHRPRAVGRLWLVIWGLALLWSGAAFLDTQHGILNPDGWPALGDFWAHAARPDISPQFLRATIEAVWTTVAFGVLGTLLSVVLGVALAPLMSQTWWAPGSHSRLSRGLRTVGLLLTRVSLAFPRGVHEAVWGLLLLSVLGRDPLVGVLAIAIPFGAITAKVYSELLDEADPGPYQLLRAAGAGRTSALVYGVLPGLLPTATSYAFYRFECSIRSAVILGMIGAGGIGLQLSLSFQGLQYAEMWTSIYALLVLGAIIDRWGAMLRRGAGGRRWTVSAIVLAVLTIASVWHLSPDLSRWFSSRTGVLLDRLVDDLVPPSLPEGGWPEMIARSVETLQMSIVAISIAATLALAVCPLAARGGISRVRRAIGWLARQLLLLTRAIPPPVWALLVLFVIYPGPLPGALALGIYTFGILGRLFAEVVEDLDRRPREVLSAIGAPTWVSFAYATVPGASGQLVSYSLYRWEVTARETVIVGLVGAGGLGRLFEQQRVAFDYSGMAGTICALVVVCIVVDLVSLAARTSLR